MALEEVKSAEISANTQKLPKKEDSDEEEEWSYHQSDEEHDSSDIVMDDESYSENTSRTHKKRKALRS